MYHVSLKGLLLSNVTLGKVKSYSFWEMMRSTEMVLCRILVTKNNGYETTMKVNRMFCSFIFVTFLYCYM